MAVETPGNTFNMLRLRSGRYLDIANPKPEQFRFSDIAGGLSKLCRFGGQLRCFYSVAEHSVLCAQQAEEDGHSIEEQVSCLLHDASEAFIGDVIRPLKRMLSEYREIECMIEEMIWEKYDLRGLSYIVKEIDNAMLFAERSHFFADDGRKWDGEDGVRVIRPHFLEWEPVNAEAVFTQKALELGIDTSI